MKDIDEIRRSNLALIVQELGSVTALAQRLERSDSQVSQLINGSANSKTGRPRGMRKETARRIEAAAGKPAGWLDVDHGAEMVPPVVTDTSKAAWAAYNAAGSATRAVIDLLLLPPKQRAALLATHGGVELAVKVLEADAPAVLALRKSA